MGPFGRRHRPGADNLYSVFGISGTELIILAIITFVVIGPERMPEYARQIREFVKTVRRMAFDAKDDFKEALGETGLEDINWRQYDPRQYDPRVIVRQAFAERARGEGPRGGAAEGAGEGREPLPPARRVRPLRRGRHLRF